MKSIFIGLIVVLSFAGYRVMTALNQLAPGVSIDGFVSPAHADSSSIAGSWFLQAVLASDTATGKTPTITFNLKTGSFSGNTGCNTMHGSLTLSGKSLTLEPNMGAARMTCPGYNEAAFLKSLQHANGYKVDHGVLILLFDATELSRWTRRPSHTPVVNKA